MVRKIYRYQNKVFLVLGYDIKTLGAIIFKIMIKTMYENQHLSKFSYCQAQCVVEFIDLNKKYQDICQFS